MCLLQGKSQEHKYVFANSVSLPLGDDESQLTSSWLQDLNDLKPLLRISFVKERPPLILRPLFRIEQRLHQHIVPCDPPLIQLSQHPRFRNNPIHDNNPTTFPQRRYQRPQYAQAILRRPVMQNESQEVGTRATDRLRREEIMRLELDMLVSKSIVVECGGHNLQPILHYTLHVREPLRQRESNVATTSSDIDYGAVRVRHPIICEDKVGAQSRTAGQETHGAGEVAGPLGLRGEVLEEAQWRVVGETVGCVTHVLGSGKLLHYVGDMVCALSHEEPALYQTGEDRHGQHSFRGG